MTPPFIHLKSDGPLPPGENPPVPVKEPPDGHPTEPGAPVDEPAADEPMRQ